ncbi:MAG: hypothetical protein PUJ82_12745 [Spirochaetales bacterium]|nr:hypothetical protein [Bacilli bacterium]MDD7611775.1 hypothetical protein [Spirochaetales bacterium]MDY5916318.1 hypothetical protein [Treponema sp.]
MKWARCLSLTFIGLVQGINCQIEVKKDRFIPPQDYNSSDNVTEEVNRQIPTGWYKNGREMLISYFSPETQIEYVERCVIITTDNLLYVNHSLMIDNADNSLVHTEKGYTFSLEYAETTSSGSLIGSYHGLGIGSEVSIEVPFFEAFSHEFSLSYMHEYVESEIFENYNSVTFSANTHETKDFILTRTEVYRPFMVLRFRQEKEYKTVPCYDSKGYYIGTKQVFSHYKYTFLKSEPFSILVDRYYQLVS